MSSTSAYREFTGKSVEEALRLAREDFGVGLDELDFEILTPGSRGVLGMGAEPARVLAAPRSELGGAAPKREAAAARPLPAPRRAIVIATSGRPVGASTATAVAPIVAGVASTGIVAPAATIARPVVTTGRPGRSIGIVLPAGTTEPASRGDAAPAESATRAFGGEPR